MRFVFAASMAALGNGQQSRTTHAELAGFVENGQWAKASALSEQLLRASKAGDARLQWLAAQVKFAYGDLAEGTELTEKAATLDPKNADYQFFLFEVYGSQAQQASILRQLGLARKCKKAVDATIALDPKHAKALMGLMMYLYRAPSLFGGDKQRALAIPGEIGKFDPARGHLAQAELDVIEKQYGKARESYRKAVAADQNLYPARISLARSLAYNEAPDLAQAEVHAHEAVRINGKRCVGWDTLAYALGRQGKVAELEQAIAQSEESSPGFYGGRGLLEAAKDWSKAEQLFRQYLKYPAQGPGRPSLAVAHLSRGLALEKQGRRNDALAELETAARLNSKHPAIQKELKRLRG